MSYVTRSSRPLARLDGDECNRRTTAGGTPALGRRRGLTIVFAMVMLALIGVTFTAMVVLLSAQAKRTKAMPVEAQQRQLLTAGTEVVLAKLQAGAAQQKWEVPLPKEMGNTKLLCQPGIRTENADIMVWRLQATVEGKVAQQEVRLERVEGRWRIVEARLGRQ